MKELTIKEAAEALGVSTDTVRRRIRDNKIKAWKAKGKYGKQWIIDADSLAEYQHIVEAVPIKREIDTQRLTEIMQQAMKESNKEYFEDLQSMQQEHNQAQREHIEELQEQTKLLQGQIEELKDTIGKTHTNTWIDKIKGLFKG